MIQKEIVLYFCSWLQIFIKQLGSTFGLYDDVKKFIDGAVQRFIFEVEEVDIFW